MTYGQIAQSGFSYRWSITSDTLDYRRVWLPPLDTEEREVVHIYISIGLAPGVVSPCTPLKIAFIAVHEIL